MLARHSASCFYGIMRDVSEQHAAKAALKGLLLSTSFDLRMLAQNVLAASALLASRRRLTPSSV